jgi:hypothetical protein
LPQRRTLPEVKAHAELLHANVTNLKNWMLRTNRTFTLFPQPTPEPRVEKSVILIDDHDIEMEDIGEADVRQRLL